MTIFSVADVAEILSLSRNSVLALIHSARLTAFNVSAGEKQARYRVTQQALQDFVQQRSQGVAS
jgi:hypothetical protein